MTSTITTQEMGESIRPSEFFFESSLILYSFTDLNHGILDQYLTKTHLECGSHFFSAKKGQLRDKSPKKKKHLILLR